MHWHCHWHSPSDRGALWSLPRGDSGGDGNGSPPPPSPPVGLVLVVDDNNNNKEDVAKSLGINSLTGLVQQWQAVTMVRAVTYIMMYEDICRTLQFLNVGKFAYAPKKLGKNLPCPKQRA
jgi:hypothetical protein